MRIELKPEYQASKWPVTYSGTNVEFDASPSAAAAIPSGGDWGKGVSLRHLIVIEYANDDADVFGPGIEIRSAASFQPIGQRRRTNLRGFGVSLINSLRAEPFEEGMAHPGELIIHEMIRRYAVSGPEHLQELFLDLFDSPSLAASLLKCSSRVQGDYLARVLESMIIGAFRHWDVEVREAGAFAMEVQDRSDMVWLLQKQYEREEIAWLRDYLGQLIRDFQR